MLTDGWRTLSVIVVRQYEGACYGSHHYVVKWTFRGWIMRCCADGGSNALQLDIGKLKDKEL